MRKSSSPVVQGPTAGRSTVLFVEFNLFKSFKLLTLVSSLTFGMNMTIVVLFGTSSVSKIYQVIFTVPGVALTSVMACNVQRKLLSEERQGTEEGSGNTPSLGLSFTDIISFLTRPYRSEGGTNNTGHVGAQNDISEVKTSPTADLETAV